MFLQPPPVPDLTLTAHWPHAKKSPIFPYKSCSFMGHYTKLAPITKPYALFKQIRFLETRKRMRIKLWWWQLLAQCKTCKLTPPCVRKMQGTLLYNNEVQWFTFTQNQIAKRETILCQHTHSLRGRCWCSDALHVLFLTFM